MNHASVPFLSEISPLHSSLLPITCETLCVSLVGPSGLEPPTSCLSGTRSNLLSYEPLQFCGISHSGSPNLSLIHPKIYGFRLSDFSRTGGDDEIRTHDPLLAGQVLSQLSYTPGSFFFSFVLSRMWKRRPSPSFRRSSVHRLFFCFGREDDMSSLPCRH